MLIPQSFIDLDCFAQKLCPFENMPQIAPTALEAHLHSSRKIVKLLEHIPLWEFPWFLLWLLPLVHRSFEGCSGTHYPWNNLPYKNLGGSSPVNAMPTQRHTSCWLVFSEIGLSARLGSHLMCGGWCRLAETIVHLDLFLCVIPVMSKTSSALP